MKYGIVLSKAFASLKSKQLWAYSLSALAAIGAPFAVVAAAFWALGLGERVADLLGTSPGDDPVGILAMVFTLYAVMLVGGLLSVPIGMIAYGGQVYASNRVLEGAHFTIGEAWRFGAARVFRTLGVEAVLWLAASFLIGIAYALMFAIAILPSIASGSEPENRLPFLVGMCFGQLVYLFAIIVVSLLWQGIEGMSIRYALLGDRTVGSALSAGLTAFRRAWKRVVVFGLIIIGLGYAWQLATSIVAAPLVLLGFPWDLIVQSNPSEAAVEAAMSRWFRIVLWVYPAMFVLYAPYMVFTISAWTGFFRAITGMDAPAPAPYQAEQQHPEQQHA